MTSMIPPDPWRPAYPSPNDERVELQDCELQTFVSNGHPGVFVPDHQLDAPACFWIDANHVYVRLNWGKWATVSLSNPSHVAAMCAAPYCQITHSLNGESRDLTAPVHHIAGLPAALFTSADGKPGCARASGMEKDLAISALADSIPSDLDAMAFRHVRLDGEDLDLVVSNDELAVVFAVYPEDEDHVACPRMARKESTGTEPCGIPATLLDDLVGQRAKLCEMGSDATISLAIVASTETLENMRNAWGEELEDKEIELVEYQEFEIFLRAHFPPVDEDDEEEDE